MPNEQSKEVVIRSVVAAFANNSYPGDDYLLGSRQGCEPFDEVLPFQGKAKWQELPAEFLDQHAGALHFFSEAGLRFFLPAFLVADLRGELKYADPLFTVTSGFTDIAVEITRNGRKFLIKSGKSQLLNPSLYGAMTFLDYARYRLSIFTRKEAVAIVGYLECKKGMEEMERERIEAALNDFWRERARAAPRTEELSAHIKDKEEYVAAISEQNEAKNPKP
ncbi:MAG: hypothetical protein M3P45_15975 [Acidobacteriota bacterium]|nr:hypothetical protein [Acidobacteriota bacterium]